MIPEVKSLKDEQKIAKKRKKVVGYSKVLTNRMTIVGWKLFKSDYRLHFAFVLYRLKIDFGFTAYEIANLTGVPVSDINNFMRLVKPVLDSEILKILGKMDEQGMLREWRELPDGHGHEQGYFVVKDKPAWLEKKRWKKKPELQLGSEMEKKYAGKNE